MSFHIVRAIDVGFGNTKFVALRQGQEGIHCGVFPSIAPQASVMADMGAELFQRRNISSVKPIYSERPRQLRKLKISVSEGTCPQTYKAITSSGLARLKPAAFVARLEMAALLGERGIEFPVSLESADSSETDQPVRRRNHMEWWSRTQFS